MKSKLRLLIREMIHASSQYKRFKEEPRELIQRNIIGRIRRGIITSDRDLHHYLLGVLEDPLLNVNKEFELAITALKEIPFSVWSKIS